MHPREEFSRVLSTDPGSALAAREVDVAEFFKSAVALPTVGDHLRSRLHEICHEGVQRCRRCIGERSHPAAAEPSWFQNFHSDAGQDFLPLGAPARQPRLLPADVGLIHLHQSGKSIPTRSYQH